MVANTCLFTFSKQIFSCILEKRALWHQCVSTPAPYMHLFFCIETNKDAQFLVLSPQSVLRCKAQHRDQQNHCSKWCHNQRWPVKLWNCLWKVVQVWQAYIKWRCKHVIIRQCCCFFSQWLTSWLSHWTKDLEFLFVLMSCGPFHLLLEKQKPAANKLEQKDHFSLFNKRWWNQIYLHHMIQTISIQCWQVFPH